MISRWKKKKKNFERNRIRKTNRMLKRNNRRKRNRISSCSENAYSNRVFSFLQESDFAKRVRHLTELNRHKIPIEIPVSFSISENPNESIDILKKIFYFGSQLSTDEIEIDHSKCINLEIAASTIMDVIVLAITQHHRNNRHKIVIKGKLPRSDRAKDIFMASGLPAHMKLFFDTDVKTDKSSMELFKLINGAYRSGISDSVSTRLTEYIMKCMRTQGYTLTASGMNSLSVLFGEVLNNCELHAGDKCCWFALGHYQTWVDNGDYGEMQLVIFDFGDTFYESLKKNSSVETRRKLDYLTEKHREFFSKKWDPEMLYTLFSFQEGISRLRDSNRVGNVKRGTGTIRLIENFSKIGKAYDAHKPLMTVTSGATHIKFNDKYSLRSEGFDDVVFGRNTRKIIAFNSNNSIFEPPDENNVIKLKEFFPGTVISMDFFFDKKYLQEITGGNRN